MRHVLCHDIAYYGPLSLRDLKLHCIFAKDNFETHVQKHTKICLCSDDALKWLLVLENGPDFVLSDGVIQTVTIASVKVIRRANVSSTHS